MRSSLLLLLTVLCVLLVPQTAAAVEYNCEAVAHQVTYDYYTGACPIEGSGGCMGEITEEKHTFQCVPDGYICY